MRTLNKHPDWYNQPLRLSKEELVDPRIIIENFFETYHLEEIREILWDWLVEVISSERSISLEAKQRNDHMYFYEKIELLVEAAFVINKRTDI